MTETEIKLQVPREAQRAVDAAVVSGRSARTRLQAVYFDTADRRLAKAGIALRLRKEGRHWVQTVKAVGRALLERLEHNVPVTAPGRASSGPIEADPRRHADTAVGALLDAALAPRAGEAEVPLTAVYRTDIRRRHRRMRTVGGEVELAYDEGFIVADGRRLAVAELEIELVRGRPEAVVDVAQRWASRHHLWIDTRSKAERGERLATGAARGPAVKAGTVALDDAMTPGVALQTVIETCLTQVLRNASEVASGEYDDEHVHQLRVGLRRVRSALRLFEGWASGVEPGWPQAAAVAFRQLGATRDRDALRASLLPRLRDAGAPVFDPFPPIQSTCGSDDPVEIVRSPAFTTLALQLQRFVVRTAPLPAAGDPNLRTLLQGRLDDWHRLVLRDARRFADLPDDKRHRLRKRLKRLRYAVEFVAALYPPRAVGSYLELLAPAQDSLGSYIDVCVALGLFTEVVVNDPRAWFAVGWLKAKRGDMIPRIADELKQLHALGAFWA